MTTAPVPALGIVLVPTLPPEALRPLAAAADRHLDELWVWEDCFKESSIAAAGAALAWTDRVRVGIGLAPVPLRNVALLAMELATLHRLFPGRLLPGVGHGVQDWMDQVGARAASPLTLLREYTEALRLLLDGVAVARAGWVEGRGAGAGRMPVVTHLMAATGPGAEQRLADELRRWDRTDGALGRGVAGDATTVADAVRRLAGIGATSVVFQPTQDEPDLESLVEFVGRDVRSALAR